MNDTGPYCVYPDGYGYILDGDVQTTATGYQMTVKRAAGLASSPYSTDVDQLTVIIDFQTASRLRIQVSIARAYDCIMNQIQIQWRKMLYPWNIHVIFHEV